jgi:hypothetical protein
MIRKVFKFLKSHLTIFNITYESLECDRILEPFSETVIELLVCSPFALQLGNCVNC